jgi:hypothetical protein
MARTKAWLVEGAVVTWRASRVEDGQPVRVVRIGSDDPLLAGGGVTVENVGDGFRFWTTTDLLAPRKAPRVETRLYRESHGTEPRGRGGWAFTFDDEDGEIWWATRPVGSEFATSMTYAEARRMAVAEARARGAQTVWVQS